MRISRVLRVGAAAAAAGLVLSACADDDAPAGGGGEDGVAADDCPGGGDETVTIGTKSDQPGLGQETPDGYDGMDVAMACYIAKQVYGDDVNVEWAEAPTPERENMIENESVDFIVATYTISDERKERVDFAGPYFMAHQDLLVREDYDEISSEDDLGDSDLSLCSVTGSTSAQNVKDDFAPDANLVEQQGYSECITALENEEVDAITTDDSILAGLAAQHEGQFKLTGLELSDEPYGVGIAQGNDELKSDLNDAITQMVEDGEWENFVETYLGPAGYETPEPPEIEENGATDDGDDAGEDDEEN